MQRLRPLLLALATLALPAGAQYSIDASVLPTTPGANNSSSENIDFADVDLDGDWDALFGDGGDSGNDQNRIWINAGGIQAGTIGDFVDETSTRLPVVSDNTRDVEFVDFDGDGDADVYIANTSDLVNQTNRWWTNEGGTQGGSAGFFVDETQTRWIGLGAPGSSIGGGLVLGSGGFIDWTCDCDFGDLDNDGDLDLVHSSYGRNFGGAIPTRLFLNDGNGFFREFNPQGVSGVTIGFPNGTPGIWCEGTQQSDTTNADGTFCDIAATPLDIDVGDIDGDLDLDILHGSRNESPRMFRNRLEENGGSALGFRDVTGAIFPPNFQTSVGHYEQEMGDMDGDGDLDIYGLNWLAGMGALNDISLENDGTGSYSGLAILGNSGGDDNEGDFVDYDGDGDIDLFVSGFSTLDRLYRNDTNGGGIVLTEVDFPNVNGPTLDSDVADTDGDGDYDILAAKDVGLPNRFFRNTTQVPDTHGPDLYNLEDTADGSADTEPEVARVQVYDNAPYYITWYNETALEVTVDGVRLPDVPMVSSAGQIFRGEIPGNLVGAISYRATSTDEHGNTGFSSSQTYSNSGPVGNVYGTGSSSSAGEPELRALSAPIEGQPLFLAGGNTPASPLLNLIAVTGTQITPALDLGGGLVLNLLGPELLLVTGAADANGDFVLAIDLPVGTAGFTVYAQFFTAEAGPVFASSKGLELAIQ